MYLHKSIAPMIASLVMTGLTGLTGQAQAQQEPANPHAGHQMPGMPGMQGHEMPMNPAETLLMNVASGTSLRAFGRNLVVPGAVATVRLIDPSTHASIPAAVDVAHSDSHALRFTVPGGLATGMTMPEWSHRISGSDVVQKLQWSTYTLAAAGRAEQPFAEHGFLSHFAVYGQLSAGLAIGHTKLVGADGMSYGDTTFGPAFGFGAGATAPGSGTRQSTTA